MNSVAIPIVASRVLAGTRDLLDVHAHNRERYPFLLESVARGPQLSRFDILFAFPGSSLVMNSVGEVSFDGAPAEQRDFLASFDAWWSRERTGSTTPLPLPFVGGWFVYLGYELAGQIEPTLRLPASELPLAVATRIPAAIVQDRVRKETWLIAEATHQGLLDVLARDFLDAPEGPGTGQVPVLREPLSEEAEAVFLEGVERILRYIHDGDVFQVNLSRGWEGLLRNGISDTEIYRRLRRNNPAPFAGLAAFDQFSVLSSSPERLLRWRDGRLETRPIAGTRSRALSAHGDRALAEELMAHPKEKAEHVMLIDLERNDLGRVCQPGSVEVNEFMVLESYAHVHHIVSNVRGRPAECVTPGMALRAVFPGGTITGCPKVRCMQIISEMESTPRHAYTGSFGYVNRTGAMDMNILIRSILRHGLSVGFRAGAGIVADSLPPRELEETRAKAKGLVLALESQRNRH